MILYFEGHSNNFLLFTVQEPSEEPSEGSGAGCYDDEDCYHDDEDTYYYHYYEGSGSGDSEEDHQSKVPNHKVEPDDEGKTPLKPLKTLRTAKNR